MSLGTRVRRISVLLLAALTLGALGCATNSESSSQRAAAGGSAADPAGSVPADLWMEIVVRPGHGIENRAKVEERVARFVLLPDGALHGEADTVPPPGVRPARVRRLSREQMSDVWSAAVEAGFSDPRLADTRANVRLLEPGVGEVLATLEVHAHGERFAFVRRYKPGDELSPAMRRMIRSLASLAWSSDEALAESAELPARYDAGPDPYARFAPRAAIVKEPAPIEPVTIEPPPAAPQAEPPTSPTPPPAGGGA